MKRIFRELFERQSFEDDGVFDWDILKKQRIASSMPDPVPDTVQAGDGDNSVKNANAGVGEQYQDGQGLNSFKSGAASNVNNNNSSGGGGAAAAAGNAGGERREDSVTKGEDGVDIKDSQRRSIISSIRFDIVSSSLSLPFFFSPLTVISKTQSLWLTQHPASEWHGGQPILRRRRGTRQWQ